MGRVWKRIQVKFEPRDLWVGLYWDWVETVPLQFTPKGRNFYYTLVLYICILPAFPIIIKTGRGKNG
jgi:hypothetical protein